MAKLVSELPEPLDLGSLRAHAASVASGLRSGLLVDTTRGHQAAALKAIRSRLEKGLLLEFRVEGPKDSGLTTAAVREATQTFQSSLWNHLDRFNYPESSLGTETAMRQIPNRDYFSQLEWARSVVQATDSFVASLLETVWRGGFWPAEVRRSKCTVTVHLVAFDEVDTEVRDLILEFDRLANATADVTKVAHAHFQSTERRLRQTLTAISEVGDDDDESYVPPRFLRERLEKILGARADTLEFAKRSAESLVRIQSMMETAIRGLQPIELRVQWESFQPTHQAVAEAGLLHWLAELAPNLPSHSELDARFRERRPPVMVGALEARVPRWEGICGSSPEVVPVGETTPLLAELQLMNIPEQDEWIDRLARLGFLAVHHGVAIATEPPDVSWLLAAAALPELLIENGAQEAGCRAAVRQIAVHLAQRPDLGEVGALAAAPGSAAHSNGIETLVKLLDVVTRILVLDLERTLKAKTGKRQGEELSEIAQPLLAWLQGVARPWFMRPGGPPEVLRAYAGFLKRMERVTGLAWVGVAESTL